jgi:hypothetical protein
MTMEIQTNFKGYGNTGRPYEMRSKSEDAPAPEVAVANRRENALTGSSAVLSSTLAGALLAVKERREAASEEASSSQLAFQRSVEESYFEFAN